MADGRSIKVTEARPRGREQQQIFKQTLVRALDDLLL
jgi:hypothetical protein